MLRVLNSIFGIVLLLVIVSCSATTTEPKEEGINPNSDILAQFSFKNKIYSIEGNMTPAEKIKKEIGKIEKIVVDEIKENGQAKIFDSKIDLLESTKIFSIQDTDKDLVVAIKINDIYYTAIFWGKLD
ncbi:NisI/SpaI family lantibiotic immunity lipoprotein [Paenibacillus segetis]|uniref:Lipoprotein n=1 Tax=Paenibacillus segetis TaxID=1325360 RepID=A0ABQ1YCX4_9BACL|nr:NisI/SpaI family lantibiotic immunity lipoprotein [Paenibacillus segetis]GGH19922.1 hypothetical protein GCM10008013_16950 [Paenibacillus segetis]